MGSGEGGGGGGGNYVADPLSIITGLVDFFENPTLQNPFQWFITQAEGLPAYVKTAETGQRLAHSHSPLVIALGIHFYNLAITGHYLSSTPDLTNYFGPAMKYTTSCLYGYEPTPVNPYMQAVVFSGAPISTFDNHYFASNPPQPELLTQVQFEQINPGHIFPTGFYNRLQKVWSRLYPTFGQPPPPTPPPPPPTPITLPPYQGPPPDDGSQDELSQIGQCLCSGLNWIIQFIQTVAQQPQSDCCNQLVAALTGINSSLGSIFTQLSALPSPAPPPDFTPLVTELTCLCTAAQNYPAFVRDMVVYLGAQMAAVAKTIVPPIDLTPISDPLNKSNAMWDVPQALLDQLAADGAIPKRYSGLLQGIAWADVKTFSDLIEFVAPYLGVFIKAASGDPDIDAAHKKWIAETHTKVGATVAVLRDVLYLPANATTDNLKAMFVAFLKKEDSAIAPILEPLVQSIVTLLTPGTGATTSLGNIGVKPGDAISAATGVAMTANIASWLLSYAGVDEGETLTKFVDLIAAAVGYEEIRDVLVGPYIRHGIAAVADMNARSLFRQHLPQG